MNLFDLSSNQKTLLSAQIKNPNYDSFYLKFKKDYDLDDFEYVKKSIEFISHNYLNLQIKHIEKNDFKQYFTDDAVNIESFEIHDENLEEFINNYFDKSFDNIFDSPLYKWAILKTDSSIVLIGLVQHILLNSSSLYTIIPQEIERYMDSIKNNDEYRPIDFSYGSYEVDELNYINYINLINSFDNPTSISPDVNGGNVNFKTISKTIDVDKLENLSCQYNLSKDEFLLAIFLYNLTKFSFSKDILISYNHVAAGYHFNTDLSVEQYLDDFKQYLEEYDNYSIFNNQKLNFGSEILFACEQNCSSDDYKLIFNFDNGKIKITYDESFYSKELMSVFLDSVIVLFEKFTSSTEVLKNISIRQNLESDEGFKIELANEGVVNTLFENIVSQNSKKTILYAEDGEFSYDELNKKANRIANSLIKRGVKLEDKIMFMMRRNSDLIATVLGILKAGAAFIPIDPNYPKNRINQILSDSDSKFIITSSDIGYDGDNRINVDELLRCDDDSNPQVDLTPDNLSFLIYTSGSTGKPKGVMITHRGITNYIANVAENVPIYELNHKCNKFVSISTVSFIVFLREIFGTILNGLPVVFANDEEAVNPLELANLFKKSNADAFGSTPTRLLEYLQLKEIQEIVAKCKVIIVGGEGFPPVLFDRLSKFTKADIYNSYGPTEVTIASHYKLMESNEVTAGWKMLNVVDKIMDIDGNQLPDYVTGEIYVGGAGIARGYLNNPDQSQKVFLTLNNIPYYNTGDLGKKDNNGELYVLGRNDSQIKLRGLRIELSEIEGAIANYDNITLSKVLVKKINSIEHLCAYFTATCDIDIDDLTKHLSDSLPEYMVPSYFTQLEEFPKTPNGKTDFKKLPDPVIKVEEFIKPGTDIERELFDIISNILGISDFGINTNLFNIGLTSLTTIQVVSAVFDKLKVKLNVLDILKYKTIENIASNIKTKEDNKFSQIQELYPLTSNQLGVYFDCMKNPESLAYNLAKIMEFSKDINPKKLKSAIIKAINNHPYLKIKIVMENGQIYQKRQDEIVIDDLIEITDECDINDFVRPFNFDDDILFRFKIVGNRMLLADFHHLIVDGVSLNILFDEISSIYDQRDYSLEEMDGFEYCLNELQIEKSPEFKEAKKFFEENIVEFDEATVISQDINGDEALGNVKQKDIFLNKDIINKFTIKENISPNNLFLAATSFVISKFVFNKDLLIATITNGRFDSRQDKTIAMMVKTLPLMLKLDTDLTISQYFDYINNHWFDVLTNSSYPLTKISDDYGITPEILYAFQGRIIEDINMDGMIVKRNSIGDSGVKFKIAININEIDDKYNINCEYNDQLYSDLLIDTLLDSLDCVLNKFLKLKNNTLLKNISISHEDNWMENDVEYVDIPEKRVNKIFESYVENHLNDIALYATDGDYTFNQLNKKANRIANALIRRGVGIEDKVMIILKRDSNFIASMFAILKAGAAFIPIDSDYPKDRIEHVLTDSQSKFIITDDIIDKKKLDLGDYKQHLLDIDDLLLEDNDENPDVGVSDNNLAYIIYTSGSTGIPKGVMLEHGNLANFVYPDESNICTYELASNLKQKDYKVLSTTTVAFDVFMQEVMASLLNGIPIVFASDDEYKNPIKTKDLILKSGANVYVSTPSRLLQYLEIDEIKEVMYSFKAYLIAGEPFPPRLFELLSQNTQDAKIFNMYGPTEATVYCNGSLVTSTDIDIGKALFNVKEQIMDQDSNPLPDNVMGELYIAGRGVSREYLNRPENNEKAFININGIKYYKSGDLAKKTSDGIFHVYGRLDNQIKLHGLRIELGEIESVLSKQDAIKEAVVVVKTVNDNDYLCAYFTVFDDSKIDTNELKKDLEKDLVYYMVPSFFTQLDEFPRTPSDKIDTKNLPDPKIDIDDFISPRNDKEQKLWDIVSNVLGITSFGVNTDLLNIGLTSLTMMQVVSDIYEKFNTQVMITEIMKNRTIENISTLINDDDSEVLQKHELYSLTPNQLGLYFECVKKPEDLSYNMPIKIEFGSDIDPNRLKSSIIQAIDNHPYLKTRIIMEDGEVYQERRDDLEVDEFIEIIDSSFDEKSFVKPFVLDEGPLFRFKICKNTTLLADFHHIIVDGTSLNIFFDEIAKIYDDKQYSLEQMDGYEYSLNEIKIKESNLYKESELFFFDKIKDFEEASVVSPDLEGVAEKGVSMEKITYVKKDIVDKYCSENNINPNNLFLAITSFTLSKFVYNKNLLFATLSNGRFSKALDKTIAMMVKTLPLVLKLNTELSIKDYLEYINNEWLDVLTYSSYPLTKISSDYNITPQFLYTYQGRINENIEIGSKTVKREFIDYNFLKFNMGVQVEDIGEEYAIICQYNNELYSDELVEVFSDSLNIVLNKFINYDSDTPLNTISIVEKDMISKEDVEIKELPEYRLNKIFESCVENNKNELAISAEDGDFTYEELNIKANRIANALIKRGVEAEDKVMFILKRNSNVFASIFGILKSGAAFIPVDSDYPKDRVEHVLTDSESKFIIFDDIVDKKNIDLSNYSDNLINISDLLAEEDISNPNPDLKPDNLAYIIYTSGSTGLPKGVMLEHKNLANFVYPDPENIFTYDLASNGKKEKYKSLSISTVAFDMLLHETMTSLLNGIPIAFANDIEYKDPIALCEFIKKTNANVYSGTPSRLLQYLELDDLNNEFSKFKLFAIGGEAFPPQLLDILDTFKGKVYNIYGPTETTICCNTRLIDDGQLKVGKPLFNVYESVMDLDGNPLPQNVVGELYIAGSGVSRAYLNRPEKNAESFVNINGIRFYRSGDYAKLHKDGDVSIYGRLDNQIKLRGLRIEIGEIESEISKFKAIKDVAVVVRKIKNNQHLCAYFTVTDEYLDKHRKDNEFSFDIDELKKSLSEKLTYYMVPTVYMQLDEMPQTLNGKTDLKNLPEPVLTTKYVAPENDVEAFFANTFADILELDKVSVTDNFFEIGGTSLLVTKITMAALNRNYEVYYGDVFKNPTPRALADFVYNGQTTQIAEESKYDYSEINKLLAKNTLDSLINGEIADSLGDVLLTGATGFLGIHVLHELITSENGNIYCFVRSRGDLSAQERLKSLLFYYFSTDYSDLFDNRIHVIEGDITSMSDFESMMAYNVDTLINCAANVKHFSSGTDIEDINLGGVINGLKFAKMKECAYVQISTYSVAGLSIDNYPDVNEVFTEDNLYIGQNMDNAYIISKFLAERAVLEAAAEDDLNVKIMRVGNLMARSSDSEFQINYESNGFINRLKAFATVGKVSYDKLDQLVEFSPIDITAKSIVNLAKTPKECVMFHSYNSHSIRFSDVIEIIKDLNMKIEYCEEEEYQKELNIALKDKNRQDALSGIITNVGEGQIKSVWIPVTNDYTTQVLYRLGIVWPLIDNEYIFNFIKHLLDVGFF